MTPEQKQEIRESVHTAAVKTVEHKKAKVHKKVRRRVRKVVRTAVTAGAIFCVGYAVGVHRHEIAEYLRDQIF